MLLPSQHLLDLGQGDWDWKRERKHKPAAASCRERSGPISRNATGGAAAASKLGGALNPEPGTPAAVWGGFVALHLGS